MIEEIWLDIQGYNGKYKISNLGRVLSYQWQNKPKYLSLNRLSKDGYPRVALIQNGKSSDFYVHRLVAQAFIPNMKNHKEVNHKDGIKTNNVVSNLEWVTHATNMKHASDTKLMKSATKENNPNYKGKIQVIKDGQLLATTCGLQELKDLGLIPGKVYNCLNGKAKSHKGYTFKREV